MTLEHFAIRQALLWDDAAIADLYITAGSNRGLHKDDTITYHIAQQLVGDIKEYYNILE